MPYVQLESRDQPHLFTTQSQRSIPTRYPARSNLTQPCFKNNVTLVAVTTVNFSQYIVLEDCFARTFLRKRKSTIYDFNVWTLMETFSNVSMIIFRKCMKVIFQPLECLIRWMLKICLHIFKGIFCPKKSWNMNFQFLPSFLVIFPETCYIK